MCLKYSGILEFIRDRTAGESIVCDLDQRFLIFSISIKYNIIIFI